jgi:hypothetical protein
MWRGKRRKEAFQRPPLPVVDTLTETLSEFKETGPPAQRSGHRRLSEIPLPTLAPAATFAGGALAATIPALPTTAVAVMASFAAKVFFLERPLAFPF